MKKHIPNLITCCNLFCGCIAVYFAFDSIFEWALIFIFLSAVFDFLDGFSARLLKAYSDIGKELDSLADVVSFGVAPAALVFSMLRMSGHTGLYFAGFLIAVFSALRLAKFNLDTRQTNSFLGLPVPANAIFWTGMATAYSDFCIEHPFLTLALVAVSCFLLVSEIPMFSLKIKGLAWKDNKIQYIFLAGCLLLLVLLQLHSIPLFIVWYIVLSVILRILVGKKNVSNKSPLQERFIFNR